MVEVNKYTIEDFNIILKHMIIENLDDDVKNDLDFDVNKYFLVKKF